MGDEVLQCLVDSVLGVACFQRQVFSVDVECGVFDGVDELCSCLCFVFPRFFLMALDDVLYGRGELCHVFLSDVFLDFHDVFEGLVVGCVGEDDDCLPDGFGDELQVGFVGGVRCYGEYSEFHAARRCAHGDPIHHGVNGEVVSAVIAVFSGGVDVAEQDAADLGDDGCGVHGGVAIDVPLDVLFLVGEEAVDVPGAADVVLREEALQGGGDLLAHGDFVEVDLIRHEDDEVVEVGFYVVDVAHEVEEFQDGCVLDLQPVACLGGTLGALDDAADGAVEEGVYGVVEEVEGREGVLAPVLDALRCLLEAGEHGALSAGEVFAGVAVLADLGKDFLHEDKLIGDEGEGPCKFGGVSVAADVLYCLGEAEDVFQDGVVLPVEGL